MRACTIQVQRMYIPCTGIGDFRRLRERGMKKARVGRRSAQLPSHSSWVRGAAGIVRSRGGVPDDARAGQMLPFDNSAGDVVGLPDGERDDGQRRVLRRAGGELAAVGDEEVRDVVALPAPVDHPVARVLAHPVGAEVVRRRIGRRREGARPPRPPRRSPRRGRRRGCAWRRRSGGRRSARSAPAGRARP